MPDRTLYDSDTFSWAMTQADALRDVAAGRRSNAVDWDHVIEEIESLGKEQRHALRSHLANILAHLLKLDFSTAVDPVSHWRKEVRVQRAQFEDRLFDNPGLKPHLAAILAEAYVKARKLAASGLEEDGITLSRLPQDCPYTLDQVRDFDWFPVRPADGAKD